MPWRQQLHEVARTPALPSMSATRGPLRRPAIERGARPDDDRGCDRGALRASFARENERRPLGERLRSRAFSRKRANLEAAIPGRDEIAAPFGAGLTSRHQGWVIAHSRATGLAAAAAVIARREIRMGTLLPPPPARAQRRQAGMVRLARKGHMAAVSVRFLDKEARAITLEIARGRSPSPFLCEARRGFFFA